MRQVKLLVLMSAVLIGGMAFSGFDCASTEITSAKLYIQQKNLPKALDALQKEVTKNPKSDEGYYLMGVIQGEQDKYEDMVSSFDKSIAISKKFEKQITDTKRSYWANNFNKGVMSFSAASKTQNADSSKMFFEKSIAAFKTATMLEPDSAEAYKNMAYGLISIQKEDEAIAPLEKVISLKKSSDAYRFLGSILYNKGLASMSKYNTSKKVEDSTEAMAIYSKAITLLEGGRKVYPSDEQILSELSNVYIASNKLDVAADAFKAGIAANPKNKGYRYNYGVVLLGASKYAEAIEQFEKAIEIDPNYQNAIYNLAISHVKWGVTISKEIDDKKLDINSAEYKEKDAQVKKEFNTAIPLLEKVVSIKGDDANVWENLGKIYAVMGMKEKADDAFAKADKLKK